MTTTGKPKLGYLGLGLMGSQMCHRLMENGYEVTGFDPVSEKVEAAVAKGITAADSPRAVAEASDIVLACVITTPIGDIRSVGKPGKMFVFTLVAFKEDSSPSTRSTFSAASYFHSPPILFIVSRNEMRWSYSKS